MEHPETLSQEETPSENGSSRSGNSSHSYIYKGKLPGFCFIFSVNCGSAEPWEGLEFSGQPAPSYSAAGAGGSLWARVPSGVRQQEGKGPALLLTSSQESPQSFGNTPPCLSIRWFRLTAHLPPLLLKDPTVGNSTSNSVRQQERKQGEEAESCFSL